MEKSKKHYWCVTTVRYGVKFEGSFTECWNYLMTEYADYTVADLVDNGVRITRNN